MTKNRLGSVCGALPWKLDIRSSTYAGIRNAQNEPTGIVLMSTGTPTQKAAMNYIIQCANLMPEAVEIIKMACFSPCRDLCEHSINGAPNTDIPACHYCPESTYYERGKAFLAKLEGGAEDERD